MKAAKHNTGILRRFIKWAGFAATTGLILLWIGSGFAGMSYTSCALPHLAIVGLVAQGSVVVDITPIDARVQSRPQSGVFYWFPETKLFDVSESWAIPSHHTLTMAGIVDPQKLYRPTEEFTIPIWLLVILCATPTAISWRRDGIVKRRLKSGSCPNCTFSFSGLAPHGVCPECGKAR